MLVLFVSEFDLLRKENQEETGANFGSKFFVDIVSLQEGVSDSNEDEVRAGEEEDKLVEEDSLASAVANELENEDEGDGPLKAENGDQGDSLVVDDVFHGPVKEGGGNHTERREAEIDWDQHNYLDVGKQLQSQLQLQHLIPLLL